MLENEHYRTKNVFRVSLGKPFLKFAKLPFDDKQHCICTCTNVLPRAFVMKTIIETRDIVR